MIKIEFFRASKNDVNPGEKIIISGLISAEVEDNYFIKLHIIGTNIKKETIKINCDLKETVLRSASSQKVMWEVDIPKDFNSRYNFIGYIQWTSKETKNAGILSSYLFSAGHIYDVEVIDNEIKYDEENNLKGIHIHAVNKEIEPVKLKIPLLMKSKDKKIFTQVYEVVLNYEEIIEIEIPPIKPVKDAFLKFELRVDDRFVYKSNPIIIFPDFKEEIVKYNVNVIDNITMEEKNEISIYLKPDEHVIKRSIYFDLHIFVIDEEKWIASINNSVIFGLNWEDTLGENPLIYDSFKDFLFSYIYFTIFQDKLKNEMDIWKMNKSLNSYLKKQLPADEKRSLKKVNNLDIICDDIINFYDLFLSRNFISNNQFKSVNSLRKNFYTKYTGLKESILGITEKERKNFNYALEKIEKEKKTFKDFFTKIFNGLEDEMKVRNMIAATRRFLTFKLKRDSNKALVGKESFFKLMLKNESNQYSLPIKMELTKDDDMEIIKPKTLKKNILVLPENFSGWLEEDIVFKVLKMKEDKFNIDIEISIGAGNGKDNQ